MLSAPNNSSSHSLLLNPAIVFGNSLMPINDPILTSDAIPMIFPELSMSLNLVEDFN